MQITKISTQTFKAELTESAKQKIRDSRPLSNDEDEQYILNIMKLLEIIKTGNPYTKLDFVLSEEYSHGLSLRAWTPVLSINYKNKCRSIELNSLTAGDNFSRGAFRKTIANMVNKRGWFSTMHDYLEKQENRMMRAIDKSIKEDKKSDEKIEKLQTSIDFSKQILEELEATKYYNESAKRKVRDKFYKNL